MYTVSKGTMAVGNLSVEITKERMTKKGGK
jgi:hypothetical protein